MGGEKVVHKTAFSSKWLLWAPRAQSYWGTRDSVQTPEGGGVFVSLPPPVIVEGCSWDVNFLALPARCTRQRGTAGALEKAHRTAIEAQI